MKFEIEIEESDLERMKKHLCQIVDEGDLSSPDAIIRECFLIVIRKEDIIDLRDYVEIKQLPE